VPRLSRVSSFEEKILDLSTLFKVHVPKPFVHFLTRNYRITADLPDVDMHQFPYCKSNFAFLKGVMISNLCLNFLEDQRPLLHSQKFFEEVPIELTFALTLDTFHYAVENINLLCIIQDFLQVLIVLIEAPQEGEDLIDHI
jgi:hypothetical protein